MASFEKANSEIADLAPATPATAGLEPAASEPAPDEPSARPAVSPYLAGLAGRCPNCGQGKLFEKGLALRERCAACGSSFAAADPGDGPAVFAIFILGFVILGGALLLEFRVGPPVWVHVLLWGLVTPLFAFFLLRVLKATLIALQFKHKAQEGRLTLTS